MRRSRFLVPVTLLTAATLVAGCSSGGQQSRPSGRPTSPGPAAPDQAMITWMDQVCAADADLRTQRSAAQVAALSLIPRHPTAERIAGFVASVRKGMEENLKKFQKIGKVRIPGGDQVTAAYITTVKGALAKLKKAKKSAKDPSTPKLVLSYLPQQVSGYLQAATPRDADLPGLTARNPSAKLAAKKAKNCTGSQLTTSPPR